MGYTVTHQGEPREAAFLAYARQLRQQGIDLARAPRVLEPAHGRRWLYVWPNPEAAQAFADELRERTGDAGWLVMPVAGPTSAGPLGPLIIQLVRQTDGLTFALHPLSRALLRSAFPAAVATSMFVDLSTWSEFRKSQGGLQELLPQLLPGLTGLALERLEELGYAVLDADTQETLVFAPSVQPACP